MKKIPYSEDELRVVCEIPAYRRPELPKIPLYDFPVSPREAYSGFMNRDPIWQITGIETVRFCPSIFPDYLARGYVMEAGSFLDEDLGGKDMFGVEWQYDDKNRGSAVIPGDPLFTTANYWEDKLVWPDVDSWDWVGSAKANATYTAGDKAVIPVIMTGYFERLISFMDFGNAAIALIDEYQQESVKALFERMTDLYIQIVDNFIEYFDVDGFIVHDDWGSQNGPLFSTQIAEYLIVPAMKRLTDHIHEHHCIAELHSCGFLEMQVPNFIAAGWDTWSPQPINDTHNLYDKYGDQIIIGVIPDEYPQDADEIRQRDEAAKFVAKFCNPEKPALLSIYGSNTITPAFREELYRLSRQKFF